MVIVYVGSNLKEIKNIKAQRKLWYSYKKCVFLQKKVCGFKTKGSCFPDSLRIQFNYKNKQKRYFQNNDQ